MRRSRKRAGLLTSCQHIEQREILGQSRTLAFSTSDSNRFGLAGIDNLEFEFYPAGETVAEEGMMSIGLRGPPGSRMFELMRTAARPFRMLRTISKFGLDRFCAQVRSSGLPGLFPSRFYAKVRMIVDGTAMMFRQPEAITTSRGWTNFRPSKPTYAGDSPPGRMVLQSFSRMVLQILLILK